MDLGDSEGIRAGGSRRGSVEPFRAMEVVGRASALEASGQDIVSMCVGQPAAPAPAAALRAAARALEKGRIGYTPSPGIPALRERIARYYDCRYAAAVEPERVFVTTGSSAGFMLAFLACFDPGARVAIPSPGYPAYRNILRALSLEPVEIETRAEDRWAVTAARLDEIHRSAPVDGVLVANPNNPNGTMLLPPAFRELAEYCRRNAIRFISDEIYHGITYGTPEVTAANLHGDVLVINSFSKFFCMTGWRVGWMIVPRALCETVDRLQQNLFISAPELSQIAALAAFDGIDEMQTLTVGYESNRDLFLKRLPQMGFGEIQPVDGAFYAYCNSAGLADDSAVFASRLLEEAGVAITPGRDFDARRGGSWVRLSFCGDQDRLAEGLDRMESWIGRNNR